MSDRSEIAAVKGLCVKCMWHKRTIGAFCSGCKKSARDYKASVKGQLISISYNNWRYKYLKSLGITAAQWKRGASEPRRILHSTKR